MSKALRAVLAALLATVSAFAVLVTASQPDGRETPREIAMEVSDKPAWTFDTAEDLQKPELPTGCEATAVSTLLRMHGVDVGKEEVADAMPRSGTDFVHSFWGDPRSPDGGCCMSPCAAETARRFLVGRSLLCYQAEGIDLADLPTPSVVWVTIDLAEPQGPIKAQGAYEMFYPSHCVTVTGIEEGEVRAVDPLKGEVAYRLGEFERVYETLGAQAIWIGKE